MLLFREGVESGLRPLQDMLRDRHERIRRITDEVIAERLESDTPLDDGDGPLVALRPYKDDPRIEGVRISIKQVSTDDRSTATFGVAEAVVQGVGAAEKDRHGRKKMREFVLKAVAEIDGLEFDDGPAFKWPDDIAVIEANGLLSDIYHAALTWNDLSADEKKLFGSSPRSTSPNTTATSAPKANATTSDATATPKLSSDSPQLGGKSARARSASSDATNGPSSSSGPTTPPAVN